MAATPGWRYIAQRLTGKGPSEDIFIDGELPLESVQMTDVLSGPTQLSGKIDPEVRRLVGPDGLPLLLKGRTAIYAEHDGVIRAGAILGDPGYAGPEFGLRCSGFSGYPQGQPYTESWVGTRVDPTDVFREIWRHLQAQRNGNLGMVVDDTTTPVRVGRDLEVISFDPLDDPDKGPISFESGPARLSWYTTEDLGEAMDKLAAETPFDYHERHEWVGDEIHHFLDIGYPTLGRRRSDLRFVVGENISVIPRVTVGDYATEVLALGAGEWRTMRKGLVTRPAEGLRRAVVVTDKSRRTQRSIDRFARQELQWRTGQHSVADVVLTDHTHAPVGSLQVGDEILVQGPAGWVELEVWCRVISISIRPDDGDSQVLAIQRSDMMSA